MMLLASLFKRDQVLLPRSDWAARRSPTPRQMLTHQRRDAIQGLSSD